MKKTLFAAGAAVALFAAPAFAEPEYRTVEIEMDVNASAEHLWETVGDYCAIADWGGLDCEITSGDGGVGTVRSLFGGRITEILVGKTDLSYGYAQPAVEGQFYDLYHGYMEAKPVTDTTSKMIYTLMWDVSNLADDAAKDADVERRRGMFTPLVARMKEMAEAE